MEANQDSRTERRGNETTMTMIEITLRGTTLLFDMQLETARNLMQIQARTAALWGAPDYSSLLRASDGNTRRFFTVTTEQVLNSTRQANETVAEMNRQVGELMERQTAEITEEIEHGIEAIGRQTQEGLEQVRQMAQQGNQQVQRNLAKREGQQPSESQQQKESPDLIVPPRPGAEKRPQPGTRPS